MKSLKFSSVKLILFITILGISVPAKAGILEDSAKLKKLSQQNLAQHPFTFSRPASVIVNPPSVSRSAPPEIDETAENDDENFDGFLDRTPQCPPIVMPVPILLEKLMNNKTVNGSSCSSTCLTDRDCPQLGHRCCDDGCGKKCTIGMQIQKIPAIPQFIPPKCPGPTSNPSVVCGADSCKTHDECEEGEMCCLNQCASQVCTRLAY